MKGAVLYDWNKPLVIEEFELDEPGDGEVRIKMMASGVCHSDWHVIKGDWSHLPLPMVIGHEGAGLVEAVGPNITTLQPGDHVILSWKTSCGLCEYCQQGWPNICERAPVYGQRGRLVGGDGDLYQMGNLGTFATHAVVPEVAAIAIDPDIPWAQASLVGCGVTTGVGAVTNTARVRPGSSVAVLGCGGVGLNVVQGARLAGATTIIAVDLNGRKLEMARQFGATHTINASEQDPVEGIKELTGGGAHYAFEAIGLSGEPYVQSIQCTRRRGMTVWVGNAPVNTIVSLDSRELMAEKTVIGCMYGSAVPRIEFPRLLNLYRSGQLMLDELVTRQLGLEEVNEAFDLLARGEVARSVLTYD